jgi:hypothetical protein
MLLNRAAIFRLVRPVGAPFGFCVLFCVDADRGAGCGVVDLDPF